MRTITDQSPDKLAAVFLDYRNLYDVLEDRVEQSVPPNEYITDVLAELRRYLREADGTRIVKSIAYADFSEFESARQDIERKLFALGSEPRYVPSHASSYTSELQLSVDALETLYRREEISTFVFISGNREYYPLVRQLTAYGRNVIVVALESPSPNQSAVQADGDVYLDMMNLMSDDGRRTLLRNLQQQKGEAVNHETSFSSLTSETSLETLKIAEEYFGQYEEIYLTPLLRKLSEVLGSQYDPKFIISELEDAGAVRLEKREGYPYNYTVLIINENHPDVKEIHESYYTDSDSSQPSYDYDDYTDGEFDDEFDGDFHEDEEDDYTQQYADDYMSYNADGDIEETEYGADTANNASPDNPEQDNRESSEYVEEERQA